MAGRAAAQVVRTGTGWLKVRRVQRHRRLFATLPAQCRTPNPGHHGLCSRQACTELSVVRVGVSGIIPQRLAQLGWQESLILLAKLVEAEIPD